METLRERVIAALKTGPKTRPEIAEEIGIETDSLGSVLTHMCRAGELSKEGRRGTPYTLSVGQKRAVNTVKPKAKIVRRVSKKTPSPTTIEDKLRSLGAIYGLKNAIEFLEGELLTANKLFAA